jgi:NAD(P)H dehydrogenase (quinone)
MKKNILITYFSVTGNTKKLAETIAKNIDKNDFDVILKSVDKTTKEDMLNSDAIIVGSPTYYGMPSKEIVELLTERVRPHGQLQGKLGAAFSSSNNIGGGNETTIMSILHAMLIHGMIVKGFAKGDHYGAVSIGSPDERVEKNCKDIVDNICSLLQVLKT